MPAQVSVIIPAYNGAQFLGQAIQSVLDQTYPHFQVIVVDDASPDHTAQVVQQFGDARVKYVRHDRNRGAVAARYTGVQAAEGDIIALLDQDDLFHPDKLKTHTAFLENHPQVGVSYNARFDLRDDAASICGLWQPPQTITLADMVSGYPISPSDTVMRREWALNPDVWDDSFASSSGQVIFNGQEIVFGGRLLLAGCQFGNVGRALNYRRYHSDRMVSRVAAKCRAELACQALIFNDARCPASIRALQATAFSNLLLIWSYIAFFQQQVALGQEFLKKAVRWRPCLAEGQPCELVEFFAASSAADKRMEPDIVLERILHNLPASLNHLESALDWAVGRAFLYKGMDAIIWNQDSSAQEYLARAAERNARIDESFIRASTSRMMDYETEFGPEATRRVLGKLGRALESVGGEKLKGRVAGNYWIHRAFLSYKAGKRQSVPSSVLRGVLNDPRFLSNRGVGSIFLHSISKWSLS